MKGLVTYALLDLGFALLYGFAGWLMPAKSSGPRILLAVLAVLLVATAVGLVARARWGRLLGLVTCGTLLACAFVAVALLVASAAYLRGVYGAFGTGAALLSVVAAALIVELMVLLPAFQIRFLRRPDVRRSLGA
jgi:hypothetical protein